MLSDKEETQSPIDRVWEKKLVKSELIVFMYLIIDKIRSDNERDKVANNSN